MIFKRGKSIFSFKTQRRKKNMVENEEGIKLSDRLSHIKRALEELSKQPIRKGEGLERYIGLEE